MVKLFRSKSNCNFDTEGQKEAGTQGEEQALVGIASVDGDPALQKILYFLFLYVVYARKTWMGSSRLLIVHLFTGKVYSKQSMTCHIPRVLRSVSAAEAFVHLSHQRVKQQGKERRPVHVPLSI